MWIDFRHKFHSTYLMLLTVARVLVCGFPFPCDKILAREISRSGDPSRDVANLEMLCLRFGKECGFGSLKPSCGSQDRWIVRPWRVLQQQDPPGLVRPDSELFWNCCGFIYISTGSLNILCWVHHIVCWPPTLQLAFCATAMIAKISTSHCQFGKPKV